MAAYTNTTLVVDTTDVLPYLGEDIDTTYDTTMQDDVGLDAEASVCCLLKYDVVTNYASITAQGKRILSEYVARAIAVAGMAYKFTGEAAAITRVEGENRINVHLYRMQQIEKLLSETDVRNYLGVN